MTLARVSWRYLDAEEMGERWGGGIDGWELTCHRCGEVWPAPDETSSIVSRYLHRDQCVLTATTSEGIPVTDRS